MSSGLEALEDQLRYLKVCLGIKINTNGSKFQQLTARKPFDS